MHNSYKRVRLITVILLSAIMVLSGKALADDETTTSSESVTEAVTEAVTETTSAAQETTSAQEAETSVSIPETTSTETSTANETNEVRSSEEPESAPAQTSTDESNIITDDVSKLEAMLDLIDESFPDENLVALARALYNDMTMAQQVRVNNIDKLFKAERLLSAADNTEEPDSDRQKVGTKYSFRLNQYLSSVSLYLWYTADTNGDGRPDAPIITVVAPDGQTTILTDVMLEMIDSQNEIAITRSSQYTKLDFIKAREGTWTVRTGHRVSFELRDIDDAKTPFSEAVETNPEGEEPAKEKTGTKNPLLVLGLFLAGTAALFFFLKKLGQKKEKEANMAKSAKPDKEKEDVFNAKDYVNEWSDKNASQYVDEPKQVPKKDGKDERLMETQEDFDDDTDIEDIDEEDIGFFTKPRFPMSKE